MTDHAKTGAETQRDALRARIDAAERRSAERTIADQAREAAGAAAEYTRAHPLTVVGGAVAVGLAIGLLTPPGRRAARKAVGTATGAVGGAASSASAGVKSAAARGSTAMGALFGQAALGYLMDIVDEALDTARAGQERASDLGDAAGARARKLRRGAVNTVETASDNTRAMANRTRAAAVGAVRDLVRATKR